MSRNFGPDDRPRMPDLRETDFAPDDPYLAEWLYDTSWPGETSPDEPLAEDDLPPEGYELPDDYDLGDGD